MFSPKSFNAASIIFREPCKPYKTFKGYTKEEASTVFAIVVSL